MSTLLEFKPLSHSPGVLNATILVKPNVRVSISKGRHSPHIGYVGDDGSYQCAIQVNDPTLPYWCLVMLPHGDTVKEDCTNADIETLKLFAMGIETVDNIWVFDTPDNNPKRWVFRFTRTNLPDDANNKTEYAKRVWGAEVKILPLGVKP